MKEILKIDTSVSGELVQITEGQFLYTFLHSDKRGDYVIASPYSGQASDYQLKRRPDADAFKGGSKEEKPSPNPIFMDIAAKILSEFWSLPKLKKLRFEWAPIEGQMWCRVKESEFMKLERVNDQLRRENYRLRQELGRVPVVVTTVAIEKKADEQ